MGRRNRNKDKAILPGGLVIEIPLGEVDISNVHKEIIKSNFIKANLAPEYHKEFDEILDTLQSEPTTFQGFIAKQEIYNYLSYAYSVVEMRQNPCRDVTLIYCNHGDFMGHYMVKLDRAFCENRELKHDAHLVFEGGSRPFYAKVIDVNLRTSYAVISLRSSTKVKPLENERFDAYLLPCSFTFKSRHRALFMLTSQFEKVLYPDKQPYCHISIEDYESVERVSFSDMFSTECQLNDIQKSAILAISSGLHGSTPYLLFGPPGTGKTTTLVEVVRLLSEDPLYRILICTPSNTAADLFASKLLNIPTIPPSTIFRLFSFSKVIHEQDPALLEIACTTLGPHGETFGVQPIEILLRSYRIIVSTLSSSTYLVTGGLQNAYTHVFVDEAGQADELDTLIPIAGMAGSKTRVILAGDPKQLGPIEMCELLKPFKMNRSLIERLINYREGDDFRFDKRFVTMLTHNYRSHPSLVHLPSTLFYGGHLIAMAPIESKNTLCQWGGLPTKGFPLFWHSIDSQEDFEPNGHSICNMGEVEIVCYYLRKLMSEAGVKYEDIGIISPYKYQVKKIREKLGAHPECVVDSVERFQGSESRVIIVSTVRSNGIGFLDCDKRFNTAITRAKELLIIIGNHRNLSRNESWYKLVDYCRYNNALIIEDEITAPAQPINVVQKMSTANQGKRVILGPGPSQPTQSNVPDQRAKSTNFAIAEEEVESEENYASDSGDSVISCRASPEMTRRMDRINAMMKNLQL